MLVIGQVVIEPSLFHTKPGRIAYIFITGDPRAGQSWDPQSGEDAVIIQQSSPTRQPVSSGRPKLTETIWCDGKPIQLPVEFEATLKFRAAPEYKDYIPHDRRRKCRQPAHAQLNSTASEGALLWECD